MEIDIDEAKFWRFITPDVLFEKYVGWSPYHYSLDNPVSYLDGNGYEVIAVDEASRNNIINSVESQYRNNIGFTENGTVYLKNPTNVNLNNDLSNFSNYGALKALVNTDKETFYVYENSKIEAQTQNELYEFNLNELQSSGANLPKIGYKKDELFSVNGKNIIVINPTIYQTHLTKDYTINTPGRALAHELYGHGLLWYWEMYKGWKGGRSHDGQDSRPILIEAEENVDK